jgi:hypothetical protein
MYACEQCNSLKSNRCPPENARADGFCFFRPDEDEYDDHFLLPDLYLTSKTNTGYYTIEALDLNRYSLRRLREIRKRLFDTQSFISGGIRALRNIHLDSIPPAMRAQVNRKIVNAQNIADELSSEIDSFLRQYAQSPLDSEDQSASIKSKERSRKLRSLKQLYPGDWHHKKKE